MALVVDFTAYGDSNARCGHKADFVKKTLKKHGLIVFML